MPVEEEEEGEDAEAEEDLLASLSSCCMMCGEEERGVCVSGRENGDDFVTTGFTQQYCIICWRLNIDSSLNHTLKRRDRAAIARFLD
jgi:hypothetical protein